MVLKVRRPDPCIIIIFGASGDLAARKLIPALYNLGKEGALPTEHAHRRLRSHPEDR